jgi:hypothetical protein
MLFVIGLWTFLRALLFSSATIALENLALRHQLRVLQRSASRPRLARWDRILWAGSHASGQVGARVLSSFSPPPSSPGTAKAAGCTGAGRPSDTRSAAPDSPLSVAS